MSRVGVVVVTHGDAGPAMMTTLRRMLGPAATDGIEALAVSPDDARDRTATRLREAIERVDEGRGALVICDLYGASPWCSLREVRDGHDLEVLSGVSLPMILKVATADRTKMTPAELAKVAAETAVRSIRQGDGR